MVDSHHTLVGSKGTGKAGSRVACFFPRVSVADRDYGSRIKSTLNAG